MAKGGYRGGFSGGSQANMMRQAQKMQQEILKIPKRLIPMMWKCCRT